MEDDEIELTQEDYEAAVSFLQEVGLIETYGVTEEGNELFQLAEPVVSAILADVMTMDQWLELGHRKGFCGPALCYGHDGMATSEQEDADFFDGGDPCFHFVRLYESSEQKKAVEENHAPSVWRAR